MRIFSSNKKNKQLTKNKDLSLGCTDAVKWQPHPRPMW